MQNIQQTIQKIINNNYDENEQRLDLCTMLIILDR